LKNFQDKESLLREYDDFQEEEKNLDVKFLLMMLAFLFLAMILTVPKIYLRNNIYYSSKEIYQLQTEEDSLVEENRRLRRILEDMKFRHLVTDIEF